MTERLFEDSDQEAEQVPVSPEIPVQPDTEAGAAEAPSPTEIDVEAVVTEAGVEDADDGMASEVVPPEGEAPESDPIDAVATVAQEPTDDAALADGDVAQQPGETPDQAPADEIAAAIAEANERVDAEPTLDDIAPGTVAQGEEFADESVAALDYDIEASTVSWWPFGIYVGVWVIFAAVMVWQFNTAPEGTAVFDAEFYPYSVWAGAVLTIAGPLLILSSWFSGFGRSGAHRGHLFISALIKGSIATAVGVTLWWTAILVLDQLRLGTLW